MLPLTLGGVAAFARSSVARLFLVQGVVALAITTCVLWFVVDQLRPLIDQATRRLPNRTRLQRGILDWDPSAPSVVLVDSPFLNLVIRRSPGEATVTDADLRVTFEPQGWRVGTVLGFWQFRYPRDRGFELDRTEALAWWGAWQKPLWAGLGLGTMGALMGSWALLATILVWPAWAMAQAFDRQTTWVGAWRLAGAALMPGALLAGAALLMYGLRQIPLAQLVLLWILHWPIGWVYVLAAPLRLPRRSDASVQGNPFESAEGRDEGRARRRNPFSGRA